MMIVSYSVRRGWRLQPQTLGQFARSGAGEHRTVGQAQRRIVVRCRCRARPASLELRGIRCHPVVTDPVAGEELAQRTAGRIPAVADHHHARLGRLGCNPLQPAHALARQGAELYGHIRTSRRDGVVVLWVDPQDTRGLGGTVTAHERGAEGDRHFAEDRSRKPPAQGSLDTVVQLDDLDLAAEHCIERPLAAFVNGELARRQVQVCGRIRKAGDLSTRERREQRNGSDVFDCQHGWIGIRRWMAAWHVRSTTGTAMPRTWLAQPAISCRYQVTKRSA